MYNEKKPGKNMTDILDINRALVLNTIRETPDCSRAQIARSTGLKQATITKIVHEFINCNIIIETSLKKADRGRRSIGLALNEKHSKIIGVRLKRSQILVGLYDISGGNHELISESIDIANGAGTAIMKMIHIIRQLLNIAGNEQILGIGVGLPGLFLKDEGIIAVMADFPGWEGRSIRQELEKEFGLTVYTVHDAYASGLAEWWFGKKREGAHILLSVSMEEGLGAGLVIDGKVYFGSQGIAGIGHITIDYNGPPCVCGNYGCLRNYCTEGAIIRKAYENLVQNPGSLLNNYVIIDLDTIISAALRNDTFAATLVREAGTYLGYGLVNAVHAYNPDIIVLSHQFSKAGNLYLDAVREVLKKRLLPSIYDKLRIEFSSLQQDTVLMGAVALVTDLIFMNPSDIVGHGTVAL